jgi:tetratricopeptide (TPR) repeat protein
MQFGMWLFEGLRVGGIRVTETENRETGGLKEVQFPVETLGFRTGSPVDTGLLYAAALESAGIRAALIPLSGDFLCAISLGVNKVQAESLFNGLERVLVVDDEVWLPLSMAAFNEGFPAAWEKGIAGLSAVFDSGETADFIVTEDSWTVYPPAPLPVQGIQFKTPEINLVRRNVETAVEGYIASEIEPLIRGVQAQLQKAASAALQNRLGILLTRAGKQAEAKAAYERAAGMGSAPAMTNRGNLALQENDAVSAEKWFRQALAASPDSTAAKRGLEQVLELQKIVPGGIQ